MSCTPSSASGAGSDSQQGRPRHHGASELLRAAPKADSHHARACRPIFADWEAMGLEGVGHPKGDRSMRLASGFGSKTRNSSGDASAEAHEAILRRRP